MRWISFVSKIVFICNLFYLISLYIRISPKVPEIFLTSGTVIISASLAQIGTIAVNLIYGWLLLSKRKLGQNVAPWLAMFNFLFLILQLFVFFIL